MVEETSQIKKSVRAGWNSLPDSPPYVLEEDRKIIELHNQVQRDPDTHFQLGALPEPFIGDPSSATVVLLGKNPGHSEDDAIHHQDAQFRAAIWANLKMEKRSWPFYPLSPQFRFTGAANWWLRHTRELRRRVQSHDLATRLMVIEWFPYHSKRFAPPPKLCPSQEYSFELARTLLEKGAMMILMRGKKEWQSIDSRFVVAALVNPQNPCLSVKNMGQAAFERMVAAIQQN